MTAADHAMTTHLAARDQSAKAFAAMQAACCLADLESEESDG